MPAPISDKLTAGWTATPAGPAYQAVDEFPFDDADFVSAPTASTPDLEFGIAALPAGTHLIESRFSLTSGTVSFTIDMLAAGDVVVGSSEPQPITTTPTTYQSTITTSDTAVAIRYNFSGLPAGYMGLDGGVLSLDGGVIGLT